MVAFGRFILCSFTLGSAKRKLYFYHPQKWVEAFLELLLFHWYIDLVWLFCLMYFLASDGSNQMSAVITVIWNTPSDFNYKIYLSNLIGSRMLIKLVIVTWYYQSTPKHLLLSPLSLSCCLLLRASIRDTLEKSVEKLQSGFMSRSKHTSPNRSYI